jgi:hypothetical protein
MNYRDVLYLKEKDYVATVKYIETEEKVYSLKSEINKIAKKFLFNLKDYNKLVRKELNLKNKIPIYFSENLLLFKINFYYVNFFNVLKICYEERKIIFIFKSNEKLEIVACKRILDKELLKIRKVLEYVRNL